VTVPIHEVLAAVVEGGIWSNALSEPDTLSRLLDSARSLPPADAIGFEVRLAGSRELDCGVGIEAIGSGPRLLSDFTGGDGSIESCPWHRVVEFGAHWATPGTLAALNVSHVFLEFDASAAHCLSGPSLFLGLSPAGQEDHSLATRLVLDLLPSPRVRAGIERALDDSTGRLPSGSLILHAGVMLGRSNGVRIHALLPSVATPDYVEALVGVEVAERVVALLGRYGREDPVAMLQFEVDASTRADAVGVEFSCSAPGSRQRIAAWIDRFIEDGLCEQDRAEALLLWPSEYQSRQEVGGWPCRITQEISHLKVTVRRDQPSRAKAYLTATPRFPLFTRSEGLR
jgi:hypothetical protein